MSENHPPTSRDRRRPTDEEFLRWRDEAKADLRDVVQQHQQRHGKHLAMTALLEVTDEYGKDLIAADPGAERVLVPFAQELPVRWSTTGITRRTRPAES